MRSHFRSEIFIIYFFRFRRLLISDKTTEENLLWTRVSLFTWRDDFFLSFRPFCSIRIDMIKDIVIRWAVFVKISWAPSTESIQHGFIGSWNEQYDHKSIQYFFALQQGEKFVANKVHSIVAFKFIIQPFKFWLNIQSAFNGTKFNGSQLIWRADLAYNCENDTPKYGINFKFVRIFRWKTISHFPFVSIDFACAVEFGNSVSLLRFGTSAVKLCEWRLLYQIPLTDWRPSPYASPETNMRKRRFSLVCERAAKRQHRVHTVHHSMDAIDFSCGLTVLIRCTIVIE